MIRKGIILAGGQAKRLFPATLVTGKQLLPVYDKPMVYYPLSTLLLAGIRDILIITSPRDELSFRDLLGDGSQFGVNFSYKVQDKPRGVADALIVAEEFIEQEGVCLILGDNFIYGQGPDEMVRAACRENAGATIFCYRVADASGYGVACLDANEKVERLVEKPQEPVSNWAVTGLYFYASEACTLAKTLAPSHRGELEITDLNQKYLEKTRLSTVLLGRGFSWFDPGTHQSLSEASEFVRIVEQRQGLKIGCPNEVAYKMGLIGAEKLLQNAGIIGNNEYGRYLRSLVS